MLNSVQLYRQQPTRLPRPWDSPGKNTEVGCHFLLQCMKVKSESEVLSRVRLLATPWTAAYQVPPSMGFSRQEYWSGLPLPSPPLCWEWLNHTKNMINLIITRQGWVLYDICLLFPLERVIGMELSGFLA